MFALPAHYGRMTTIYRLEALWGPKAGVGPYNARPGYDDDPLYEAVYQAMARFDSYDDEHPDPCWEPLLNGVATYEEFCGFTSKRAMRKWFRNGALRALCATGFYGVVVYEVPPEAVRRGSYQCVFVKDRHTARRLVPVDAVLR